MIAPSTRITRYGPALAALIAGACALPGLWLPFLSDDWANLAAVSDGSWRSTPFGYFRPLYLASYAIEWTLWGPSPSLFHLTNAILLAAVAALVVILIRRFLTDGKVAIATGVLFALHPYHVDNAAWIAGRSESLFALFYLGAILTYDRWRDGMRGIPIVTLLLFECALLGKETAVTLPVLLLAIGLFGVRGRLQAGEWSRGYVPLFGLAAAHFLILRPLFLEGLKLNVLGGIGPYWIKRLLGYGASAVVPAHIEILEGSPLLWGGLATGIVLVFLIAALAGSRRIPGAVWIASVLFVIVIAPSLISYQQRYFLLPSVASALAIASLLHAAGRRTGSVLGILLVLGWLVAFVDQWRGWREAGDASIRLLSDLVEASHRPDVDRILVVNMPHRIRGAPVIANFTAAVALSGGRAVPVSRVAYIDYPNAHAEPLDHSTDRAIRIAEDVVEVRLRIVEGIYSRIAYPLPTGTDRRVETDEGTILFDDKTSVRILIPREPVEGQAVFLWSAGSLRPLF